MVVQQFGQCLVIGQQFFVVVFQGVYGGGFGFGGIVLAVDGFLDDGDFVGFQCVYFFVYVLYLVVVVFVVFDLLVFEDGVVYVFGYGDVFDVVVWFIDQ